MNNRYLKAALLGSLALSTAASAQEAARLQTTARGLDGQPELVQFTPEGKAANQGLSAEQVLRRNLPLGTDDQLRPLRTETDQLGFSHQQFGQYYKGVRVEHATYRVHAKGGTVEALSGDFERITNLNVAPRLSAADALAAALRFVGARQYMWQDLQEETGLKQQENNAAATYYPQGELVIVKNAAAEPVLAWKFNIYAKAPVSRAYVYVDAASGKVVLTDAIIKHANATGTFATRYSGTQSSGTESITGGFRLRDATRGSGVQTFNARKGSSYASAVDFTDADNSWTEYANTNFDNAALDAHWGAQSVYDYWKNVQNRNSYNNAGAVIKSYIHFDDTPGDGVGFENAYWNGSVMTYGDGASTFKPLTSLDVCAHEIGHAVCETTANLTYQNESGALNEGFSDIWGAVIENYKAPAKQTWLIGEDIIKPAGYTCLRSMSDPRGTGPLSKGPAYYKGLSWAPLAATPTDANDYGGVHTNSSVLNHWFYILSVGKSGTNEGGNAYAVTGTGIGAAANIAYRAESVYLTASSTFANARTATIQAATDLYGAGSAQVTATTNAWFAVGVGAAAGTTPPPATSYCVSKGSSQAYEYIDYVGLGSIARTSGADAGYYNGTALNTNVVAGSSQTLNFSAGFVGTAYSEYVKAYADWNQDGDFLDAGETIVNAAASNLTTTRTAAFTVPVGAKNGKTRLRVVLSDNAATTACNSYSYGETEDYSVTVSGGAAFAPTRLVATTGLKPALELYPNPATDVLRFALSTGTDATAVTVTDVRGVRLQVPATAGQLDVSALAKGIYTLTVSDGNTVLHQRFVKE